MQVQHTELKALLQTRAAAAGTQKADKSQKARSAELAVETDYVIQEVGGPSLPLRAAVAACLSHKQLVHWLRSIILCLQAFARKLVPGACVSPCSRQWELPCIKPCAALARAKRPLILLRQALMTRWQQRDSRRVLTTQRDDMAVTIYGDWTIPSHQHQCDCNSRKRLLV